MTTIKEQVINSRTIRIYNGESVSLLPDNADMIITKSGNGKAFIQSKTIEESQKISDILFTNGEYHNSVTYSLFFKADVAFADEDTAKTTFQSICTTNISYMRLNDDRVSGKLVIDPCVFV